MRWLLLSLLLFGGSLVAGEQEDSALDFVRATADRVLQQVTAKKAELQQDPSGIYQLVQAEVVPKFDFKQMTQSAMGRYWRRASEEQRAALVNQFQQMLIRTYAVALLNYSGQAIAYDKPRLSDDGKRVQVPTRVNKGDGSPDIPIDYRLHRDGNSWRVYDVLIDNLSLVSNYRTSFANEIRRGGIDGLIRKLTSHNEARS